MTDEESQFSPIIEEFMSSSGLPCSRIPEQSTRTPDFVVPLAARDVLLELKIKSDNPIQVQQSQAVMASGGIGTRSKPIGHTNTVSGVIADGAEQMIEYDQDKSCHHLLWLHASGYDATAHWEQLISTLYGSQRLFSSERPHQIQCYFFHNSEFWRYRQTLAAAFVSVWESHDNLSIKLCVNPHYSRKMEFRDSAVYKALYSGMLDVERLEDGIEVFFMDGACDRKDSCSVLDYLRTKYALEHLQTFDMGYQYAGMWVPRSEDEN